MQVRLIALAAAAVAATPAFALTPSQIAADRAAGTLKEVVIHGGSAQSNLVAGYMGEECASGTLDTYQDTSTVGKNYKAYACLLKAAVPGSGGWPANTPLLVIKRDLGGSIYGVNPIAKQWMEDTMVVDTTCTNAGTALWNCGNVELRQAIAGISDVEPNLFNVTMTNGTQTGVAFNLPDGTDDNGNPWAPVLTAAEIKSLDSATANQTIFAIAVNGDLRNALQAAQGLTVGSTSSADQPSIPRAFYAAAVSGFIKSGNSVLPGWDALTGVPADNAKQVNICRRANGSGTQASSNLFFLNAGDISTTANGVLYPLPANGVAIAVSGNPLAIVENTSTGTAITCISGAPAGAYVMGIISYENIPSGNWSFVKIDNQAPAQSTARVGAYPYLYSATMQWKKSAPGNPDAGTKAFLVDMRKKLGTPSNIAALTSAAAKQGVLAPPSSYTGSCASQVIGSSNQLYGSCVERLDFSSKYNDGVLFYGLGASAAYKTNSTQALHIVK
jgi:hypothetical protein